MAAPAVAAPVSQCLRALVLAAGLYACALGRELVSRRCHPPGIARAGGQASGQHPGAHTLRYQGRHDSPRHGPFPPHPPAAD